MSQIPPYLPPDPSAWGYPGTSPYDVLLRPARRASWLMFILGGLLLAMGACCVGVGTLAPWDQMPAESAAQMQQLEAQAGVSMRLLFTMGGTLAAVPGLALVIVAFFVRRGGLGALITAIVLTGLILLVLLVMLLSSLTSGRIADVLAGLVAVLVLAAGFGLLLAWLIQAIRQSVKVASAQQAYQAQYWQAVQQQQAYHQPYAQQPPPPPPPPGQPPVA